MSPVTLNARVALQVPSVAMKKDEGVFTWNMNTCFAVLALHKK